MKKSLVFHSIIEASTEHIALKYIIIVIDIIEKQSDLAVLRTSSRSNSRSSEKLGCLLSTV